MNVRGSATFAHMQEVRRGELAREQLLGFDAVDHAFLNESR